MKKTALFFAVVAFTLSGGASGSFASSADPTPQASASPAATTLQEKITVAKAVSCSAHLVSAAHAMAESKAALEPALKELFWLSVGPLSKSPAATSPRKFRLIESETATEELKGALSRRLHDIQMHPIDAMVRARADKAAYSNIAGFTVKGKTAIEKFLAKQDKLVRVLNDDATLGMQSMTRQRLIWAVIFYLSSAYYFYADGVESAFIDMLIWFVPMNGDLVYFALQGWDRPRDKVDATFQTLLQKGKPGQWVYEAFDTPFHFGSARALEAPVPEDSLNLYVDRAADFDRRTIWDRWMTKLNLRFGRGKNTDVYAQVKVDRYLRIGPDGEPVLSVVVRTEGTDPTYKPPAPVEVGSAGAIGAAPSK